MVQIDTRILKGNGERIDKFVNTLIFRKIGKTFINYLKTMKQGEHEIDNSISNIIK